jgi:hypothetical protein
MNWPIMRKVENAAATERPDTVKTMVGSCGTRSPHLYRGKAALLCTANNFKAVRSGLSTPKPELLQVKKFVWNPSGARATAQGLPSKHNVDSRKH